MLDRIFTGIIPYMERFLDISAVRHKLISSNIANEETPGYKARDIRFEDELRRSMGGGIRLIRTDERHLPSTTTEAGAKVVFVNESGGSLDGNTVSLEREMGKMAENTLRYNAGIAIISKKLQILREAVREGR